MGRFKTVDGTQGKDPLIVKQKEDVANMRASLLLCSSNSDLDTVTTALNNITIMRIYHQLSRIIRFTEMMDKIEEKLYDSIDSFISFADVDDSDTWKTLLFIQEKLQSTIIDSHKLLAQYLESPALNADILTLTNNTVNADNTNMLTIDKDSRNRLRDSAQQILVELNRGAVND